MVERDGKPSGWRAMLMTSVGRRGDRKETQGKTQSQAQGESEGKGKKAGRGRGRRLSHPLAFANQSLYHAGILLSAWSDAKVSGEAPERAITLAFAAPVQARLLDGYGWLLLAACRIRQAPESPPHSVDDLPPLPAGLVHPEKLRPARSWS